jgi:hypothetical protein
MNTKILFGIKPMKTTIVRFMAKCALASTVLFLSHVAAYAIGPDYQIVYDADIAGGGTLNDVTSLLIAGVEDGTGTVIGWQQDGEDDVFAILTAQHVASAGVTQAAFGEGPAAGGGYSLEANLEGYTTFGTQDLSIMKAVVDTAGLTPAQQAELNLVQNNIVQLAPYTGSTYFTQVGYGTGGTWNPALGGGAGGYSPIGGQDDARRFQNNSITGMVANGPVGYGPYVEPLVNWNYLAASPAGGGAGFPGDSGGPYFFGGPSVLTGSGITADYSDYEEAVHVAGQSDANGNKIVGMQGSGVPLIQSANPALDSYDWAEYFADSYYNGAISDIPEPGTVALICMGAAFLGSRLGRRGAAH